MHALSRPKAVLLGLLLALGKDVYRTKFVKLTYLMDEANYRFRGESLTGFRYIWDHYGPNAANNAISDYLDLLVEDGLVRKDSHMLSENRIGFRYKLTGPLDPSDLPLSSDDWIEICTAVHKYGAMNRDDITRAAKSTKSMKEARQYGLLYMEQDPSLILTDEEIANDPFLQEALSVAKSDATEYITLEELRESIGESTHLQ